jgi:hypothetical protein
MNERIKCVSFSTHATHWSFGGFFGIVEIDLAMAEGTVLQLQVAKFALEGLVLASLARVVLLRQDALPTRNARREMTSTLFAIYVTRAIKQ